MRLRVETLDGNDFTIADMDAETVLPMVEAFHDAEVSVLGFAMDEAMAYFNKCNIVRIVVD